MGERPNVLMILVRKSSPIGLYGGYEMKALKKSNPRLTKLIFDLKAKSREQKVAIWRDIAERFERPARHYAAVNISKINRHTTENEIVLVPGKVLGTGALDHPVTVAALNFSDAAEMLITGANGTCVTIEQLMQTNPAGKGVRIIR
jgi:large subunit ribosomal protein L18e